MMFSENISAEMKAIFELELHRYNREIGHMTREEWNLLVDWVYSGHSPYMNGNGVFDDDGWPLDYINTLRSWNEQQDRFEDLSVVEQAKAEVAAISKPEVFIFPEGFIDSLDTQLD